jgi:lactoylglutathione lyase
MHIDHIAIWTNDLERLKDFYAGFFNCKVSDRYDNEEKQFSSYFLSFQNGARLEIMKRYDVTVSNDKEVIGLAHFAVRLESSGQVDSMTKKLEEAGINVESHPRTTGDGYYESVILDPDNNRIELTSY